jgi:hypothetical protein
MRNVVLARRARRARLVTSFQLSPCKLVAPSIQTSWGRPYKVELATSIHYFLCRKYGIWTWPPHLISRRIPVYSNTTHIRSFPHIYRQDSGLSLIIRPRGGRPYEEELVILISTLFAGSIGLKVHYQHQTSKGPFV